MRSRGLRSRGDKCDLPTVCRPNLVDLFQEGRFLFDAASLVAQWETLKQRVTDRRASCQIEAHDLPPVLVFPGLATDDHSTALLRRFLSAVGFSVHPWGQGINCGPRAGVLNRCNERLMQVSAGHEGPNKRVALLGWSLGGLYAHELHKANPDAVHAVVTLGSPLRSPEKASRMNWLFETLSDQIAQRHELGNPLGLHQRHSRVPRTSIYSRSDGIVHWGSSWQPAGPMVENIEVSSSHLGLVHNPDVMLIVADRLAQGASSWMPWSPTTGAADRVITLPAVPRRGRRR